VRLLRPPASGGAARACLAVIEAETTIRRRAKPGGMRKAHSMLPYANRQLTISP
jgi:hypothetical protein